MLYVYLKNERKNLTEGQKKMMKQIAEGYKQDARTLVRAFLYLHRLLHYWTHSRTPSFLHFGCLVSIIAAKGGMRMCHTR